MKTVRIGVASKEEIQRRTIEIAAGRLKPRPSDPRIWFTSIQSICALLSEENRALLRLIAKKKPDSISALVNLTGRKQSNLSRTLNTMSQYGFVELTKSANKVRPTVKANKFLIETY